MAVETRIPAPSRPDKESGGALLHRVAGWSMRHALLAVVLWIATLAGVTAASVAIGNDYHNDNSLPGTESQQLTDAFAEHAPGGSTDSMQIVLHHDQGFLATVNRQRVSTMLAEVERLPHVAAVTSPITDQGARSPDGRTAYAMVTLDAPATEVPQEDVRAIVEAAQRAATDGMQVELGGDAVRSAVEGEGGAAEGAGILAALVILVLLFGSLLAASLPLLTAVFAVGSTLGLLVLASHLFDVPDYTAPVMMLVGLGVGIDYALLIFSRYRSELLAGADRPAATVKALDTAGRSVMFAGCTVVIALLGLLALGRFALAAAAWDTGSGFSLMGASRDLTLSVFVEATLVLSLAVTALTAGSTDLRAIIAGTAGADVWTRPALALAAIAFALVVLAETGRQPVDNPDTHLELTMIHEGPLLEYAGRDLAYLHLAAAARHWLVLVLAAQVFLPHPHGTTAQLVTLPAALVLLCAALALTETLVAKMRVLLVPRMLAAGAVAALLGIAILLVEAA